jgi:uncharacterized protein YkwD
MAHPRALLIAVVSALCLCTVGASATAFAAPAAHAARRHHPLACAIRASFHAKAGPRHHIRRSARCEKRRAEARKRALQRQRQKPNALTHPAPASAAPPAAAGSCPYTTLEPDNHNIARIRSAVLCLVNRERAHNGESPLLPDARLQQSAQAHTDSMSLEDYFEHVGPHGETPLSRMRATGYIYSSQLGYEVGENIGWGTLWDGSPAAIVAAWMASPGHRANILDARFRDTGVGVSPHPPASLAHKQPGGVYTEDFGVLIG